MSEGLPHIVLLIASVLLAVVALLFVMAWLEPRPQATRRGTSSASALRVRLALLLTRSSQRPSGAVPGGEDPITLPVIP